MIQWLHISDLHFQPNTDPDQENLIGALLADCNSRKIQADFVVATGDFHNFWDTGNYLTSVFMGLLSPALLPALSFLLCMLLSFSTGTSMGTMAIMSVICFPMAISMDISIPLVAGAVFGGSIFGDHCSPISDTTIMSCATSGCDIIDHVKTQMPYVLCMAGVSLVLYVILGFAM